MSCVSKGFLGGVTSLDVPVKLILEEATRSCAVNWSLFQVLMTDIVEGKPLICMIREIEGGIILTIVPTGRVRKEAFKNIMLGTLE